MAAYNNIDDMDIDDENDWKAMDSDDEVNENDGVSDGNDNNEEIEVEVERDDDIDIGFRSHQFQYGAHGRNRKRSRRQNQDEAIYGVFADNSDHRSNKRNDTAMSSAPVFVPATLTPAKAMAAAAAMAAPLFVAASKAKTNNDTINTNTNTKADDDNNNNNNALPAPMFVAASKNQDVHPAVNITSVGDSMFVAATQTKPLSTNETKTTTTQEDDAEEEKQIAEEQKKADDRFHDLLEKAKARNKRTRPRSSRPLPASTITSSNTAADAVAPPNTTAFVGIGGGSGLGMAPRFGLPSSFGGGSDNNTQEQQRQNNKPKLVPKDPTVGTWEKHTKGFGSKLLAKMGWKGSGGLGSDRRGFRGDSTAAASDTPSTNIPIIGEPTKSSSATTTPPTTAVTDVSSGGKKGISRPVEVVVRPVKMGLGFGNFKEASQLKGNRRIEAEVRGVDYDAQLAKEKEQARTKKRQERKRRYGNNHNHYSSGSDEDDDDETSSNNRNNSNNVQSSAIPSTEDILSKRSWKAKRGKQHIGKNRKHHHSGRPEIIPYQELIRRQTEGSGGIASEKIVIIDMRGPSKQRQQQQPSFSSSSQQNDGVVGVPLGEELLYNVSFMLGTYENKLHSSARHHETTILRNLQALEQRIENADDRLKTAHERRTKLAKAQSTAEAVRATLRNDNYDNDLSQTTKQQQQQQTVHDLVSELNDIFTPQERKDLQFWEILAPTLLGPIFQRKLDNWKPFFVEDTKRDTKNDRAIVDSFFEWAGGNENENGNTNNIIHTNGNTNGNTGEREGRRILCDSMVKNQLVPKLKADIESQAIGVWDPVTNPYALLDLYEYIRAKAMAFDSDRPIPNSGTIEDGNHNKPVDDDPNQVFPSARGDEGEEGSDDFENGGSHLAEHIWCELIRDALYPKLLGAISTWKPTLDSTTSSGVSHPLHFWVVPWLPHIDHPILLPNLLTECKRKLKRALSVLRIMRNSSNATSVAFVLEMLRPWCTVLGPKSLQKMVSEQTSLLPLLEKLLRDSLNDREKSPGCDNNDDHKTLLRLVFELHGHQLLSDLDFLSLLEGPFLANWARGIHVFLGGRSSALFASEDEGDGDENPRKCDSPTALDVAVDAYRDCKICVLVDPFNGSHTKQPSSLLSCSRSLKLLRGDRYICRMFYSVARMIQIHHQCLSPEIKQSFATRFDPLEPQVQSFNVIRGRRSLEAKDYLHAANSARMGDSRGSSRAKASLRRRNVLDPTFRDVVEAFASESGVVFRPKAGAERDGKPIYLFGNQAIYLEGDVVFCQTTSGKTNNEGVSWKPVSLDRLGATASSE